MFPDTAGLFDPSLSIYPQLLTALASHTAEQNCKSASPHSKWCAHTTSDFKPSEQIHTLHPGWKGITDKHQLQIISALVYSANNNR